MSDPESAESDVLAVRDGHLRALAHIENTSAYRATRAMYAAHIGDAGVYLRPTDDGLTVLSLDHARCASMIGVGARGSSEHRLRTLPPSAEHAAKASLGYVVKREGLRRRSEEERFALRLMAHAFSHALHLPQFDAWFVHQEWKLPSGDKLDILGVEPASGHLVIVEFKRSERDARGARQQAEAYAHSLHAHRAALYPFFERLARALARAHDGPLVMQTVTLDPDHTPHVRVAWPTGHEPSG
jgi:hypothetical protein